MQQSTRRYKTVIACTACRRRKLKCDGTRPVCSRCQKSSVLRTTCAYAPVPATAPRPSFSSKSVSVSITEKTSHQYVKHDHTDDCDDFRDGDPCEFHFRVKTTIDTKLGLPPRKQRCPIPLTDAAMFAYLSNDQPLDTGNSAVDNVLPQRRQADHLVDLYWKRLDILEPLLGKERFTHHYNALFTGAKLHFDERIFTSTLNVIFALATQAQESVNFRERDQASKTYFLRAWSLLQPEISIWHSSSIEFVQCLLLMARYLQCTNSLHQTWMTVGSASRIAQSLGLHIPERNIPASNEEAELKRKVWSQCVYLDRWLSGSLCRIPMVPLASFSSTLSYDLQQMCGYSDETNDLTITMDNLNDIVGHIMLLQLHSNSLFAENKRLPNSTPNIEIEAIMQIDNCLNGLLRSHESRLEDSSEKRAKDILTSLRLHHARILLFRPMLSKFCLSQSSLDMRDPTFSQPTNLNDRVLESCAMICIESAARLVSLVNESWHVMVSLPSDRAYPNRSSPTPLIPWWFRVFYLHVACQHFVAAMLRPEIFAPLVTESWSGVVAALHAHEHISPCVQRCIAAFQHMWTKVIKIQPRETDATTKRVPQGIAMSLGLDDTPADIDQFMRDIMQGFEPDAESLFDQLNDVNWSEAFDQGGLETRL